MDFYIAYALFVLAIALFSIILTQNELVALYFVIIQKLMSLLTKNVEKIISAHLK